MILKDSCNRSHLVATIAKLYHRQQQLNLFDQNEPDWQSLYFQRRHFAKAIHCALLKGVYQPYPTTAAYSEINNKQRLVFHYHPIDQIIQSALSNELLSRMEPFITRHVYNYRGRSTHLALNNFKQYLKQHTHNNKLNLYVLRTDISAYTDSIPTHQNAPLWGILSDYLDWLESPKSEQQQLLALIKDYLRPTTYHHLHQRLYSVSYGIPTGSALTTIVVLLYLNRIDHTLSQDPTIFYARFGDDILIAHPDPNILTSIDHTLNSMLATLQLQRNPKKDGYFYLTRSATPSPRPDYKPINRIEYLGSSISANGTLSLKTAGKKEFLHDIFRRIRYINRTHSDLPVAQKGPLIAASVNAALAGQVLYPPPRIHQLMHVCNDRSQMKDLDYQIAHYIAKTLTGTRGPRAWRYIPYKTIRSQWGLISLLQLRNMKDYEKITTVI